MRIIPYYVSKKERKPLRRIAIVIITIVVLIVLGTIIYLRNTDEISVSKYFLQSNNYGKEQVGSKAVIEQGNNTSDKASNTKLNGNNETNEGQADVNKEELSVDRKIDPDKPMIALTFDDGPGEYTEIILKILKDNNSVATFYVLGNRVEGYSETVKDMVKYGNEIGNHSFNHKELISISKKELNNQIDETQEAVFTISGVYPNTIRPTYGAVNNFLMKNIDLPLVNWNIDTLDWKNKNPKKIVDEILSKVTDGDIVLMHDIYSTTADAVEIVIPKLTKEGFQLVTVSELYKYKEIKMEKGKLYFGID